MTTWYRSDNGAPVDVSEEEAPALFLAGKISQPKGSTVHIEGEDGTKEVPIEHAYELLRDPHNSLVSKETVEERALQEKYGGLGQQALTAVEQGLGGATLEAAPALEGTLFGNQQDILNRQKANPATAIGASVVGGVAPVLYAPESGVSEAEEVGNIARVGQIIGAPSRGLARAGGAVEDFLAGVLDAKDTDSFVSALAKQVAAKGAGAAVEGAGIGVTNHISEQVLGDPQANGESLLAAAGHGALLGFGAGAGIGAAGTLGRRVLGSLSPQMASMAESQAMRALGEDAAKRAEKELEELDGGANAAGRRMIDDHVVGAWDTAEKIEPKVEKASEAAQEKLNQLLEVADKADVQAPGFLASLLKKAGKNEDAVSQIELAAGIPSAEYAAERGIDRNALIAGAKLPLSKAVDLMHIPALEPIIDEHLGETVKKIGGTFAEDYKSAKLAVDQYRIINRAIREAGGEEGEAGEAVGELGGKLKGIAGGVLKDSTEKTGEKVLDAFYDVSKANPLAHAAIGFMMGGPMGAVHGLGVALLKKAAAERGAATSAVILDKLASLRGVERAKQVFERSIQRGLSNVLPETGAHEIPLKVRYTSHEGDPYEERVAAVEAAAKNGGISDTANAAMKPIEEHAPETAKAFTSAAVRVNQHLGSLIPKDKKPPSITPQFDKPPMANAAQKATFNRAWEVAHDPSVVLKRAAEGRLNSDHVKALASMYPASYNLMKHGLQERLASLKTPLSAQQKLTIGTLLGQTADVDLARKFQSTYATSHQPPPAGPQKPQSKNESPSTVYHGPKRPITAPARNATLGVGQPVGQRQ